MGMDHEETPSRTPHERRKHTRFAISIALKLRGSKTDGTAFQETTSTESVGAGGFGCRCLVDLPSGFLVDVFLVAAGSEERPIGSARVVGIRETSLPWRRYSFALLNADHEWYLVPDRTETDDDVKASDKRSSRTNP